jgi:hypothetical protein
MKMKIAFLLMTLLSVAACIPEKTEEQKIGSAIQREMELHKQRSEGWGYMETPAQDSAFGKE